MWRHRLLPDTGATRGISDTGRSLRGPELSGTNSGGVYGAKTSLGTNAGKLRALRLNEKPALYYAECEVLEEFPLPVMAHVGPNTNSQQHERKASRSGLFFRLALTQKRAPIDTSSEEKHGYVFR